MWTISFAEKCFQTVVSENKRGVCFEMGSDDDLTTKEDHHKIRKRCTHLSTPGKSRTVLFSNLCKIRIVDGCVYV